MSPSPHNNPVRQALVRAPPQAPPPTCGLSSSERLSDGPGSHSCERWSRDLNPCSIHYTPLPLVEKRQGSVMERARAEWQTGPPRSHGIILGSPAAAEVAAGLVPRAWPCARRAGWAVGPRGLLRSWVTSCCSGSGSRGDGGGRRGGSCRGLSRRVCWGWAGPCGF